MIAVVFLLSVRSVCVYLASWVTARWNNLEPTSPEIGFLTGALAYLLLSQAALLLVRDCNRSPASSRYNQYRKLHPVLGASAIYPTTRLTRHSKGKPTCTVCTSPVSWLLPLHMCFRPHPDLML